MPTYVFECPKCSAQIELIQSFKEHEQIAPICAAEGCDGQQSMRTVIQPSAVVLKGSGWTPKYHGGK